MTPEAYRARALATLGERDPVAVLESLLPALSRATSGMSAETLARPETPGKWSVTQAVRHLADTELVFGVRIRKMLAEPEPRLPDFDEDLWAAELDYGKSRLEDSLALLQATRDANLRLVRGLPPDRLARVGHHPERGAESLGLTLKLIAAHDLIHLAQIARIRKSIGVEA